jgi:DNA-binding FrmR family transcriptional regulator
VETWQEQPPLVAALGHCRPKRRVRASAIPLSVPCVCAKGDSYPPRVYSRTGKGLVPVYGYGENKDAMLKRLRRVEGQVRGLARMVESDAYCIDILTQVSATTRALQAVALGLLDDHLGHCVTDAIAAGGPGAEEKVAEASAAIARLVRS